MLRQAMMQIAGLHTSAALMTLAVVLALLIDYWPGEPPPRFHPVVWMGNYLSRAGRWLAPAPAARSQEMPDWKRFWLGAGLWAFASVIVVSVASLLQMCALYL